MSPRPIRPIEMTSNPELQIVVTDDGSRTLRRTGSETSWHSECGAVSESEWVFLRNSGFDTAPDHRPFRILEVGFGTGLNFWVTASRALVTGRRLEYRAIEPSLPEPAILARLGHDRLPSCQPAWDRFFARLGDASGAARSHSIQLEADGVTLILESPPTSDPPVFPADHDVVYHDPFSPEDAPDLWEESLLQALRAATRPGGRLVTYCVKSLIQRRLRNSGWEVYKTPGPPGGKREVLLAVNPNWPPGDPPDARDFPSRP